MPKTCFVVMPISTPVQYVSNYHDDKDHFTHVYDHLFTPAVTAAGYEVVSPNVRSGEVIHAVFVHHLKRADMVLCDISNLNPNVFFELGIRTALDKPVAMVRDTFTPSVPFDNLPVHCATYDPSLTAWTIEDERKKMTDHMLGVAAASDGNALWRSFGREPADHPATGWDDTVLPGARTTASAGPADPHLRRDDDHGTTPPDVRLLQEISAIAAGINAFISVEHLDEARLVLSTNGYAIDSARREAMRRAARRYDAEVTFVD